MSKKQLGAAFGQEKACAGERLGWFGRLRAQPGFRTAAVAFFVTIALALGGPAAYALWSQSVASSLSGTVAKLPPVVQPVCSEHWTTKVIWSRPAGMPTDAVYIVEATKTNKTGTVIFALSGSETSFMPAYQSMGSESFDDWMNGRYFDKTWADVTVSVGALAPGMTTPVIINDPTGQILSRSALSPDITIRSQSAFNQRVPWYDCR